MAYTKFLLTATKYRVSKENPKKQGNSKVISISNRNITLNIECLLMLTY